MKESRHRGFTAVEILVVLMLAAVAIPAIIQFFFGSHRQAHFVEGVFEARARAEEALDTLEWAIQDRGLRGLDAKALAELIDRGPDLPAEVQLEPVPERPGLVKVRVTIRWSKGGETLGEKNFTLARLIVDPAVLVSGGSR